MTDNPIEKLHRFHLLVAILFDSFNSRKWAQVGRTGEAGPSCSPRSLGALCRPGKGRV